jgi:hypothetical protein
MRRLAALGLVLGLVLTATFFSSRRPVDVELDLDYGGGRPREVTLIFERKTVERELRLNYPDGAPARDHRKVRLPKGEYSIGARLSPPERTLTRPLRIDEAGTYTVDLR